MFFESEERLSDSPYIEKIWRVQSEGAGVFTSVAGAHSEIVIARYDGKTTVTVRGPETKATSAFAPANGEFLGIVFKLGTFIPNLSPKNLRDRRDAPLATDGKCFLLDRHFWELPTFDNADTFLARLARAGLLKRDAVVQAALRGEAPDLSPRALQYHFVQSTGLSYKLIQQIERAQQAANLLKSGLSILDTVYRVGYYDQSHLTNALKRFMGQTPSQMSESLQRA